MKKKSKGILLVCSILSVIILSMFFIPSVNQDLFGKTTNRYVYDNGEVVQATAKSQGLLGSLFVSMPQNIFYIEKNIYKPGETIKAKVGTFKAIGSKTLQYYKVCYKGPISKCYDFTTLVKNAANPLDVSITLSAPTSEGSYILYDKWMYTGGTEMSTLGSGEDRPFTVKKIITSCPDGACTNPQIVKYYETSLGKGYCEKRECWSYSSPPTCGKSTTYKYKMSCPTGTLISGKDSSGENWQIDGCTSCVDVIIEQPIIPEENQTIELPPTGCISDVTLTCQDGKTITTQTCTNQELVNTNNECVAGEGGEEGVVDDPVTLPGTLEPPTPTTSTSSNTLYWIIGGIFALLIGIILWVKYGGKRK